MARRRCGYLIASHLDSRYPHLLLAMFALTARSSLRMPRMARMASSLIRVAEKAEDFKAAFAVKACPAGTVLHTERADVVLSKPTKYTIQRDPENHLLFSGDIKFCNHSFNPNVEMNFDDKCDLTINVVAKRDIAEGEELMFDYHSTESDMACPFVDLETGKPVQGVMKEAKATAKNSSQQKDQKKMKMRT
mmetsp:Transcript_19481/g.27177  ORF Transcript_19481/g.27177 Transcript_19481/m.27177 type:complete len:191 (+) Transcript_19481:1-573(+)